jgi:phosphopantothenoylcysteine decarboxylase/phosphopantothenate--cysteine ligase
MYQHPITQESLQKLETLGIKILPTGSGSLACGEVGAGRLLEPEQILAMVSEELKGLDGGSLRETTIPRLKPKGKILVTSGGTQEPIDAMRVLTNLSTGQTGAFLAEVLYDQGYEVYYLGATTGAEPQRPCHRLTFNTFNELDSKLRTLLKEHVFTGVIHAAAVSDFHVSRLISGEAISHPIQGKLPSNQKLTIELEPNFKILPRLKSYAGKHAPIIVGFKYTATEKLSDRTRAVEKLFEEGGVDWVVHNDQADIDKAKGLHRFTLHSKGSAQKLPDKLSLAEELCAKFEVKIETQEIQL